jgi:hypothetical protein
MQSIEILEKRLLKFTAISVIDTKIVFEAVIPAGCKPESSSL